MGGNAKNSIPLLQYMKCTWQYYVSFSMFKIITWWAGWQEEKGQRLGWFEHGGVVVGVEASVSGYTRYRPCQLPPMGGLLVPIYHNTDSHSSNQYILHVLTVVVKMSITCLFATSKLEWATTSFIHSNLSFSLLIITVEPLYNGHFGTSHFWGHFCCYIAVFLFQR